MSLDIMCNGHRFVKSTIFQSPGYLADLSPYISAVISSRLFGTPIQLTANAIKPLAKSILPTIASNFILNGTLTCEYCLHQVSQDSFDDGRICPSLLLEQLRVNEDGFILADQLIEAQDRRRIERERAQLIKDDTPRIDPSNRDANLASSSSVIDNSDSLNNSNSLSEKNETASSSSSKHYSNLDVRTHANKPQQQSQSHLFKDDLLILQICPEIGLHAQAFACVDCDKEIDLNSSRLCHYDGRYYCFNCHTGSDLLPIPARLLRSWDFTPKPISKSSLQKICYLRTKPILFNLFQINSMLYGFIDRLVEIKEVRQKIQSMLKYLDVCGQPNKPYLIPVPKHFLNGELLNFFTLNDLLDINQVYDSLNQLQSTLETHIVRKCESCRGKGFYCELCKDPHDVLYPFSKNGAACTRCHTVYHKNCFHRKKKSCPRCVRICEKKSSLSAAASSASLDAEETPG